MSLRNRFSASTRWISPASSPFAVDREGDAHPAEEQLGLTRARLQQALGRLL
jgi:hypothetical protein